MNGVLPARGDPTKAAMPWNNPTNPNAFVKDPRPSISTSIIDFRVINAAENKFECCHYANTQL